MPRIISAGTICLLLLGAAPIAHAQETPTCFGQEPTIVGTEDNDELHGTDGDDIIMGLGGADKIWGEGGNDTVCGDGNDPYIRGGAGNDLMRGGSQLLGGGGDDDLRTEGGIVSPGPGDDIVRGDDSIGSQMVRYRRAPRAVHIDLTEDFATGWGHDRLPGIRTVEGSDYNDTFVGSPKGDYFEAGDGNDAIVGGSGNDSLFGMGGSDTIEGEGGRDIVWGGAGYSEEDSSDFLSGGRGEDEIDPGWKGGGTVDGGRGFDTLYFADVRCGSSDAPGGLEYSVRADLGEKRATYCEDDEVTFTNIDALGGSLFDDLLVGSAGVDTLIGHNGNDELRGEAGDDYLIGGYGDDAVHGQAGDDVLQGGNGMDALDGGEGSDRCTDDGITTTRTDCERPKSRLPSFPRTQF